ncbi:MAG: hypothetical protein WC327_04580 [Candidatus Cloacimonadia bacterium]
MNKNEVNLIKIGRFGKGIQEDGSFSLRVYADFQTCFMSLSDFFVVYDDGRVRYLTVQLDELRGNNLSGRIDDRSVVNEILGCQTAWLALDEETIDSLIDEDGLIGLTVIWDDKEVGVVDDYFSNQSYDTLVITKVNSEETFMVPDVEEFVIEKDFEAKKIFVKNIAELMDL